MSRHKPSISRRNLLVGTASAGSLLASQSWFALTAYGAAPMLGIPQMRHHRVKLGEFEITTLLDGTIKVPKVHPIFGQDRTPEEVAELAAANFLPHNKMEVFYTPVVVNTGKELVIFDTGNGIRRRDKGVGRLARLLPAAGFKAEQIDVVVITHCHPDHIGGLMEDGKSLFPNARYVIGEKEYEFWSKPELVPENRKGVIPLFQSNVVALADKMNFLKPDDEVVHGIRAVESFGHTPGHLAFHIESGKSRLLLWADVTNHYVASLQRPHWHVVFDMDKEMAVNSRKKILDMVAAEKIPATGYHMPFPALGFVEKRADGGFYWVPASYQLDL